MINLVICPLCKTKVLPMTTGQCPSCRQTPQWKFSGASTFRKTRPLYSQNISPAPEKFRVAREKQEIIKRKTPIISEKLIKPNAQSSNGQENNGSVVELICIIIAVSWVLALTLRDFQRVPSSPTTISSETARLLKIVRNGPSHNKLSAFKILSEDTSLHDRLAEILRATGDAQLAEAYLNRSMKFWLSRGVKLENAGREWARAHNCGLRAFQRNRVTQSYTLIGCKR